MSSETDGDPEAGDGANGDLPVVDPPGDVPDDDRTVAGVVLAAGTSSRFGERNKLLATVDGVPVVRRAVETLLASRVDSVTVVVGHEADRVRGTLDGLDVAVVANPDYREGQATSVGRGVAAVRDRADAAVFALGDMPAVAPASVDALVAAYLDGAGDALACACDGQRGNPALFDARHFDALAGVEGDVGGRAILRREGGLAETGDPGVLADVDRPTDLDDVDPDPSGDG
jgi:molybdenum cofactor cytidylyltransferase